MFFQKKADNRYQAPGEAGFYDQRGPREGGKIYYN